MATEGANAKDAYKMQQQAGRKELWREALESSSQGDFFLLSLLEVVIEDEARQEEQVEKQLELNRLIKEEALTIPYRATGVSDWCQSFINDPLYKVCSVLLIMGAGVIGAIEAEQPHPHPAIVATDMFLIAWFCIECNIHIAAEGEHPQCYFFGRDSVTWSLAARWNVFDFTVSYISLVLATILTEVPGSFFLHCYCFAKALFLFARDEPFKKTVITCMSRRAATATGW